MNERITKIEDYGDGFRVTTDQQVVTLAMDTSSDCCESPGYFMSEDDPQTFVGADLLGVAVTDTALRTYDADKLPDTDCGGVMFVTLDTSRGPLQFVAYNVQNGYYGHEASVTCAQVTHKEYL